jgi:hypothetical protein
MDVPTENGQIHVNAMPEITSEIQRASAIATTLNANRSFCIDPGQYEWKYLDKKCVVVPFNLPSPDNEAESGKALLSNMNDIKMRWEKHLAWIVEGTLRRGESNILARRLFYLAEDSWLILYGEGFDEGDNFVSCYVLDHGQTSAAIYRGIWYGAPCLAPASMG